MNLITPKNTKYNEITEGTVSPSIQRSIKVNEAENELRELCLNGNNLIKELSVICITCLLVRNIFTRHPKNVCEIEFRMCSRCYSDRHLVKSCPLNSMNFPKNFCNNCSLPGNIGNVKFHERNQFGKDCCNGNGIKKFIFLMYHQKDKNIENIHVEFIEWLQQTINVRGISREIIEYPPNHIGPLGYKNGYFLILIVLEIV
jgi:hypothetical protein